jgi:membrane protein YdbS with pleckstrin-like domain
MNESQDDIAARLARLERKLNMILTIVVMGLAIYAQDWLYTLLMAKNMSEWIASILSLLAAISVIAIASYYLDK